MKTTVQARAKRKMSIRKKVSGTAERPRLAAALAAMVMYGAASAGLAALIQPIFDEVLPARQRLLPITLAILGVYVVKGLGSYLSGYLMTDVGQRVVRDLRNVLFRHILGQ